LVFQIATTSLLLVLVGFGLPRRHIALLLVLVTLLFAFESGVHSVHHLGSPTDTTDCAVATAGTCNPGALDQGTPELSCLVHRAFRGRAPPASSLAIV
jgi:hypothetical protein